MRKTKFAHTGLTLDILALGALFISKPTPVQASVGTTYTAAPNTTFKVVVQMDKTVKNPKVTSSNKKALKIVKYNEKKKKITITFKSIKTGTYKAMVKSNGKTKTIKVKIAKSNINKTAPNNITIGSSQLSLGSSLAEVQSLLENADMTLTDQGKGVNSCDTDCYYYYFNEEDSVGCLVEFYKWKSSANHSGTNSLKGKTVTMKRDLSKYDLNSDIKLKKSAVVNACKNMDALAIESGKQAIYLQNLYRVYHGLGTAAYGSDLTELAYVNAYVRSKLSVDGHLQAFEGELQTRVIRDVGHTIRVNEWWSSVAQDISENTGFSMTSPLDETLTTIASTPHLDTMLRSNFVAGFVIIDGYSNFESVFNYKMDAGEIAEAQQQFLEQHDLGISASEVSAGLYHDTYMVFTSNNTYELTYLSKQEWFDFILEKYGMKNSPGAEEYINIAYNEVTEGLCNSVYDGQKIYSGKITDDELTKSQLEEVYLYFCEQVYDTDFTNALASHFSCSTTDVYTKHSDVIKEFKEIYGTKESMISQVFALADKYGMSKQTAAEAYLKAANTFIRGFNEDMIF